MYRHFQSKVSSNYVPEHVQPGKDAASEVKKEIDSANLTEMWDMILTLDYGVSSVRDLSAEKQNEFLGVMSLLLKAFDR